MVIGIFFFFPCIVVLQRCWLLYYIEPHHTVTLRDLLGFSVSVRLSSDERLRAPITSICRRLSEVRRIMVEVRGEVRCQPCNVITNV